MYTKTAIEINENTIHSLMSRVTVIQSEASKLAYALFQTPVTGEKVYYVYDNNSSILNRDHAACIYPLEKFNKLFEIVTDNTHGTLTVAYKTS